MAARPKLTDPQLKTIRRRFNKGEQLTALALTIGAGSQHIAFRVVDKQAAAELTT